MGERAKELEVEVNDIDDFGVEVTLEESGNPEETPAVEEKPVEEEPAVPEGETPPAETPPVETPSETPPETPPASEETPPAETPPEEDDIVKALREQLAEKDGEILSLKSNQPVVEKPAEESKEDETPAPAVPPAEKPLEPPKEIDFIGDADIDDVTATKDAMNKMLNTVVQNVMEMVTPQIQSVAQPAQPVDLQKAVQTQVTTQMFIDKTVEDFYDTNKDLAAFKPTVSAAAKAIAATHPEYDIPTLFTEAGKQARAALRLPEYKPESETKRSEFDNPAFAGNSNTRKAPSKTSDLQKEIDEL